MILLACSGLGAMAVMTRSTVYAYDWWLFVAALGAGSLILSLWAIRRWALFPAIFAALLALHPAWTVSAFQGDCGHMRREATDMFSWLGVGVLIAQFVHQASVGRHKPKAALPEIA